MTPQTDKYLSARVAGGFLAGALILLGASAAAGSAAAAESRQFQLPSDTIEHALVRFAIQAGVSIGGTPAPGCGGRTQTVFGVMPPAEALARLLPPSCTFEQLDARAFRIVARPKPPPRAAPIEVVEELVVTAEKRSGPLSGSPFAVSAFTGDDVSRLGGQSFEDVASQLVAVATTNLGSGRNKIFVRGLSDGSFTGKTQSTVGLYLDDVPITYNAPDPDLRLADIERVEVLRGPQGTLYGSGSMGGVVQIVRERPDPKAVAARVAVGGMMTEHGGSSSEAEAMLNLPFAAGQGAVRGVVYRDEHGGYIDNVRLGLDDVNYSRRAGARLAVLADLPEGWRLQAGYTFQSIATSDSQYTQGSNGALTRNTFVPEPHDNDFTEMGVTASRDGQNADLKVSAAFIDHNLKTRYDATGAFRAVGPSLLGAAFDEVKRVKLWETETLLTSKVRGRAQWLVGAFAAYTDEDDAARLTDITPPRPPRSIYQRRDQFSEAAVYGEFAYALTAKLTVTAGGRWFATRVSTQAGDFDLADAPLGPVDGRLTTTGVAPKFRVSYVAARDVVIYAQVQEGYRAGGFNIPAAAGGGPPERVAARFRPDHLWNYEVGAALPLFHHALMLRSALFHADWRGLQTDQRLSSGLPMTVNIGDGSNTGLEAEAVWRPDGHLQVRANALVEDPQITRAANVFPARRDIGLPGVPYGMGSADVRYRWSVGHGLEAEVSAQYAYVGRSFLTFDGGSPNLMGGYGSARVAAALGSAAWRLQAYVDNLADETGNTFAYGNPFSRARALQATPLRPRSLGLVVSRGF